MPYVLNGQLVSIGSRQPLSGVRVEAWDKDVVRSDLLGSMVSDAEGRFTIRFDETHFRDNPKDHSPDVFFRVLEGDRLVHTTETSIHRNLPPGTHNFILEIALQSAPSDRYVVSGQVQDSEGQPLPGLLVRVFDRDLRHEELLGQVLTGAQGRYELAYTQQQFRRAEKAQAGLVVRVFGPSAGAPEPLKLTHVPPAAELPTNVTELVASDIVFNASPRQTVDMTVDIHRHDGVSEYERYLYTLGPLFELEKVALHDLTDEDIRFLNGETSIPFEHLDYLRLDAQWSLRYKVDPAVFYGLFRQKLPTNLRRLLSEKPSRLLEVLNASLAGNIIPAAIFARPKVILDSLRSLAVDLAFEPEADAKGAPPVGALLATAPLARDMQNRIVDFALRYQGEESIWDALKSEPGITEAALNSARFTLTSSALVFDHVPTLEALQKLKKNKKWKFSSDLVALKREDLARITKRTAAQDLLKGFNNTEALAEAIADRIEQVFPTKLIANRLAEDNELGSGDINFFFAANPTFDLLHTPVDTYLNNGAELGQVKDRDGLRGKLKTFQRVARLTPARGRYETMRGLIANGYTSGIKIAQTPEVEFLATVTPVIGETQANIVHANARASAYIATMTLLNLGDHFVPGPVVLPRATGELPTLAKLFGSMNNCKCKHCRSVHSPAAYLVDMLELLRQVCLRKNERGACQQTLLDVLLSRRLDIETILLDCDNANTPLPYIDLVNEILEVEVAGLTGVDRSKYQTKGSTEEEKAHIRAEPQHELREAYRRLESPDAVYPWLLPFSLAHEKVQAFTSHLGVELYEVRELFRQPEDDIARAHLGISERVWERIITRTEDTAWLAPIYGGRALTALDQIATRDDKLGLLDLAGLSYGDLQELLASNFLSGFGIQINTAGEPCNIEKHRLDWPAATTDVQRRSAFDRMHRFLRLRRSLGWSVKELDQVLTALDIGELDQHALTGLSMAIRLAKRLRLPVEEAAALRDALALARALRVADGEIALLIRLTGADPFPVPEAAGTTARLVPPGGVRMSDPVAVPEPRETAFAASLRRISRIVELIDRMELCRALGTDLQELAYILRHEDLVPAVFEPTEETRKTYLHSLNRAIRGVEKPLAIDLFMAAEMPGIANEVAAERRALQRREPRLTADEIESRISTFRTAGIAAAEARHASLEHEYQQRLNDLVIENLAQYLGAPTDMVSVLISNRREDGSAASAVLHTAPATELPAIESLIALGQLEDFDNPPRGTVEAADRLLILLDKAARIVRMLELSAAELEKVHALRTASGFLDLNGLPVERVIDVFDSAPSYLGWEKIARAKRLQSQMPKADLSLFDFLERASQEGSTSNSILSLIRDHTGWDRDPINGETINVVTKLSESFGFIPPATSVAATFANVEAHERLYKAVQWLRRFRISPETLSIWGRRPDGETSETLKKAAKARHPDELSWYKALTPIQDRLRERKRDALLAYLIAHPLMVDREPRRVPAWREANDVYAHFLIDVEMSACQLTSRIVQANSAIQLFVQRCLMNLEYGVAIGDADNEHWRQWQWMKNYRVWEANRKVFLFPENWIEPDLRDDKSPFFIELENELLQDDVTQESVERAYHNYLVKLDEVAHLDVRGFYEEEREDGSKVLHVIARTYSEPHIYFYRKRNANRTWTSWEKIDLSIKGDHIIPVVHNGRLIVFWVVFTEKDSFWELSFHWSEQKVEWLSPRTSGSKPIIRLQLRDVDARPGIVGFPESNFHFRTFVNEGVLEIELLTSYAAVVTVDRGTGSRGGAFPTRPYSIATFFFDECAQQLALKRTMDQVRFLELPLNTSPAYTHLHAQHSGLRIYTSLEERDALHYGPLPQVYEPQQGEPTTTITIDEYRQAFESLLGDAVRLNIASTPPISVLQNNLEDFSVLPGHQNRQFVAYQSLFFRTNNRTYFVSARQQPHVFVRVGETSGDDELIRRRPGIWPPKYQFETFYHPYVCPIVERLFEDGLDGVLAPPPRSPGYALLNRQAGKERGRTRFRSYRPDGLYVWANLSDTHDVFPYEQFDFSLDGAYSIYNWELFFHIPLLVADRLSKNQQFEEAQRWFHYIFDPTNTSDPDIVRLGSPRAVYWRVKPFFEEAEKWSGPAETLEEMMRRLAAGSDELEEQVNVWRNDPFNPHRIARMRLLAYMKTVVQKYLDNLIAWGDHLFQRDTMESINEAIQLYILGAEILGPRPVSIEREDLTSKSYAGIKNDLDAFSNALVDIESSLPVTVAAPVSNGNQIPPNLVLHFCVPSNEKLLSYWDTVADRLFKVRHCMDIEGRIRQLPLFAPPIDPALLVRARAAGLDLGEVISGALDVRLPIYRYQVLIQKAIEFCGEVRSLGGALLGALEKKDAEELSLLRSRHEISMLKLISMVKDRQIEEANKAVEGLQASRELAEARLTFFTSREFMSGREKANTDHLHVAHAFEIIGAAHSFAAGIAHLFPDVHVNPTSPGTTYGGSYIGRALSATGDMYRLVASQYSFEAAMASTMAGYERRRDDWNLQAELARKEIAQIDKQILTAQVRVAIAELDESNHEKQIEQAEQVEGFLKSKFTSAQLYSWMIAQVSALHYQAYRMAYDLAKKAEKAAQHELGLSSSEFNPIQFDHWNSMRKGLLAGERLHQDLRRLELAYLDNNRREFELVKHVSLRQLNPLALLNIKALGKCEEFTIPEWLFDLDCPGHFMRRVKSVGLSIPAVTGPYTSVNCTLSLLKSSVRITPQGPDHTSPNGANYPRRSIEDNRFVPYNGPVQSVVTSSGNNDSGLFETNLRDERYLPFEGAGAESTWKLELPGAFRLELPSAFRQFDYNTISDVILHIRYTARYGGDPFRDAATTYLGTVVQSANDADLALLLHLKYDFPTEWHRFSTSAETANFSATVTRDYFPYFIAGRNIMPDKLQLYVVQENPPELVAGGSIDLSASATEHGFQLSVPRAAIPPAPQAQIFALLKYSMGSNMSSVS